MLFKVGDYVSRNSYNNDTVFEIIGFNEDIVYLRGVNIRLLADSSLDDLKKEEKEIDSEDSYFVDRIDKEFSSLDRSDFFYLTGKVLQLDGDKEFLERCLKFYEKFHIMAYGVCINEEDMPHEVLHYLEDLNPDILVITGHDAYFKRKGDKATIQNYKNSDNFVKTVKQARSYEKNFDKLTIVAGACQSNYEELIRAGATFASSPKRVNIHALDPAILAASVALLDRNKVIDLVEVISKTKYKDDGFGGVMTKGMMYVGYPR